MALFSDNQDLQITNSNLTMVGGDINNHVHNHNYFPSEDEIDISAILRAVPNFRDIYHDMLEKATDGTGMWLIKGDKFRVWLEPNGDIRIFWGSGIPGAGKTVISSIVIEYLEGLCKQSGGAICVCYVYFRYSDRTEMTVRDVLEILVKQTLERHPECRELIKGTYAQHLKEQSAPTVAQLLSLLCELAKRMRCTFYILDALDEAPTKIQLAVVKILASLNIKLFITSRPLETVQARFPEATTIAIAAQDADLDLHITKTIGDSADLQQLLDEEGPSLREEIFSTIKQKCGGMFLHASLQLEALSECVSAQQVRRTLEAFPSTIEDVYLFTWSRILGQNDENVGLAKAALVWVLSASRSMTVNQLRMAVATSPSTHKFQPDGVVPSTTLISLCRGLITVEDDGRLVRLVHYTAKDILAGLLLDFCPQPQSLLAAVCMTHLAEAGFQNTTITSGEQLYAVLMDNPLLAYAHEAWAFHAQASLHVEETKVRAAQFIRGCRAFPACRWPNEPWSFDIFTPLHIIGLYKLPVSLVEGAIMGNANLTTTGRKETPLIVAAYSSHEGLVTRLLALPETLVNWQDYSGYSALTNAAKEGREDVARLLLAHPEVQINLVDSGEATPLILAAGRGHEGLVILLLAHHTVKVNSVDWHGCSALMEAAQGGYIGVVKLLLAHPGIQVNLVDTNGWSAVIYAASNGHKSVVELLLACPGILVNIASLHGSTALLIAAQYRRTTVVELLLTTGAFDINAFDSNTDTAIKIAAKEGHEAIVRMFLDIPHVDVTIRSTYDGHTALSAAQESSHRGIVQLLQDFEAGKPVGLALPDIDNLSPNEDNDNKDSDNEGSGGEDTDYYDAEDGLEEGDLVWGSSIQF